MDKTLRSILWILVTLVVLSSFSTGWFFVAKERLFDEYVSLEILFKTSVERLNRELASAHKENTELKSKLTAVEKEFKTLESRNRDLEAKYTRLLKEKDEFDREIARVKKGKFYLEKRLAEMESDNFLSGVLKGKVALEVELNRLKESLGPKEVEIEKLKVENMDMEVKLAKLNEEKELLEEKFNDSNNVAEMLSRDLLREKNKGEEYRRETEDIKAERNLLKVKLSELEDASSRFSKLLAEKHDIESKLSSLEKGIEYKDREIDKLRLALSENRGTDKELRAEAYHGPSEVELPPIVLQRESPKTTSVLPRSLERISGEPDFKGKIVTVNREHNFVVIDIGKQEGVNVGDSFNVYRGNLLIGSIEVIQTRDRIAAADIKDTRQGFIIEIDDAIVKR